VFQLSFPKSISSCFQCLLTIGQEEREIVWMCIHKMHTNKQTLSICISVYLFLSYFFHSFQKFLSISPYFTPVPILFLYKSLSKDTLLHKKCIYTHTHTRTHTQCVFMWGCSVVGSDEIDRKWVCQVIWMLLTQSKRS
jgi:hypothetical protein